MKKRLFMLLAWLICVSALAQKTIDLPYREGNTNTLDMSVYFSGQPVKPGNSLSVVAELRASDQGRVIASIPLTAVDTSAGLMTGPLPYLQPNIYYLGLYFRYSSGVQFRVGVSRVNIRPAGSLNSTPDATGLNVQISEQKVVPAVYLDATPSSSIAAYYANQARTAVRDSIAAFSQLQDSRDDTQDQQINARVTVNTYTTNRTSDLNLINQKLNIADSVPFQRKRTGWDLSQNNYSSAEKSKVASLPDLATYTSDQSAQNATIATNSDRLTALEAVPISNTSTFSNSIPFTAYYKDLGTICFSQNRLTQSGVVTYVSNTTITPNTINATPGATSLVRILADGTTPNLSAFKLTTGSQNYIATSGTTNVLGMFFDGQYYWLTMFQESGATPIDIIAPTLLSASVADNLRTRIVLTYNEALDASSGLSTSDFTVSGKTVSSVAISGSAINVDVSSAFSAGDVITISGGNGKIRDASLNIASNLSSQSVTNNITALTLVSATVADASRGQIVMTFSKTLGSSIPSASAFTTTPTKTPTNFTTSGNSATLTVGSSFALGDNISFAYTQPGSNKLQDQYGSLFASGTYNVTNNIVAPALSSALVADALRSRISVTANKPIMLGSTTISDLAVSGGKSVTTISVSGNTLNVDVNSAYAYGDVVSLTYTGGSGKLQDQYGSQFPTTSLTATNNIQIWQNVTWTSVNSLSISGTTWLPTVNIGSQTWGQTGILTTKKLAAGADGGIRMAYNNAGGFGMIGLKATATIGGYTTFLVGIWIGNSTTVSVIENGSITNLTVSALSAGESVQIYRIGSTIKFQRVSADGLTITDLRTSTITNSADLYPATDVRGDGRLYNPQSYNVN